MSVVEEITAETGVPTVRALVPACTSTTTAGWRTGGHNWRFRKISATVTIPNKLLDPYPNPEATIGLQGFSENPYGLAISVTVDGGTGASAYYGYDIGTSKGDRIPFDVPLRAGDTVKMEIFHDHENRREVFTLTKAGSLPIIRTVGIPPEHNDTVFYRHAGWNCYIDGANATMPPDTDKRLWLYRDCHATGENTGTGEVAEGGIFGPWATSREIATKTGGPTAEVVLVPGWPWTGSPGTFGMFLHPKQHKPVPKVYSTTTAGWRTGGHNWRFHYVTATVKIPEHLPDTYLHPDATIGLQGFGDNPYGLAIGVTADAGSGATAYFGYDIGTSKAGSTPFPLPEQVLPLRAGDVVKMEIAHNHAACREEFTVTVTRLEQSSVTKTVVVDIPAEHNDQVYYRHAGWNCYIDGPNATLPAPHARPWLYKDCGAAGENTGTGEVAEGGIFGPWATHREIATQTGNWTADPVMYPGWPWPKDNRVSFAMNLHHTGPQPKPMMRTWFPDAGAGASADGLKLAADQITDQAAAGFGGAEIAFLSDNTHYPNADAKTIGFGTENWRRILKQILHTANDVPGGFGIDVTLSSHWPVATNNIDPNDDAQQQQLASAWAKITDDDLRRDAPPGPRLKDLPLPPQRTSDATGSTGGIEELNADFLFADTFVAATVAKVTGFAGTIPILELASLADVTEQAEPKTVTEAEAAAGTPYREKDGVRYAGYAAGIPDRAYAESHDINYGDVLDRWGPEPPDPSKINGFNGKVDPDGNRKRMADWQYLYQTDLSNVPMLDGYIPSEGGGLHEGDFILFGTYREGTGQVMNGAGSITQYNRPYVVNIYDTAGVQALADFWRKHILDDEMIGLLRANAAKNPSDAVFEDSLRYELFSTGPLWALGLLEAITSATGDAAKYAPVFAARYDPRFTSCAAVSFDYTAAADRLRADRLFEDRTTAMAGKYVSEHIAGIKEWAATFGYTFKAQAEAGARGIAGGEASLGVVEGDNLAAGDGFRNLAAAANMGGTSLVSNESLTFVAMDYTTPWLPLVAALNSYWGAGVNRVVYHGSPFPKTFNGYHSAWPGWELPFGQTALGAFDARQIYWGDVNQLSGYAARTQAVLQSGRANVDLAVLEGTDQRYAMPSGNALQGLLSAGYSYNILDEAMLDLPAATVSKGVLAAGGASYRALIVVGTQVRFKDVNEQWVTNHLTILSAATVGKLISYAQGGLPVILYRPVANSYTTRVYGTETTQNNDTILAEQVEALKLLGSVSVADTEDQVMKILTGAGVTPAASYSAPGLVSVHRSAQGADYYLLWNEGTTLASPAAKEATSIRVVNIRHLRPNDQIIIGTGAAAETVTVKSITPNPPPNDSTPVPGPGGEVELQDPLTRAHAGPVYNLNRPAAERDTCVTFVDTQGLGVGDQVIIDTGAAAETVCIESIPAPGPGGRVVLHDPLTKAHMGPTALGTTFAITAGAGVSAAVGKKITLTGSGTPYTLDAWTGKLTPLAEYDTGSGTVTFELTLPPQAAALIAVGPPDSQAAIHATLPQAEPPANRGQVLYVGGKLVHRATAPGTYTVTLSDGRTPELTIAPLQPPVLFLADGWDLQLESWGPGLDPANPTISAKTTVSFPDITLGPWPTLPATADQLAALGVTSMSQVAGIGTYTRQFTPPDGWAATDGAYLQLTHNNDMVTAVTINGHLLGPIDPFTDRLDLGPYLLPGSNILTVRIDTTLNNRVPGKTSQPYGLTEAQLIPYVQTAL